MATNGTDEAGENVSNARDAITGLQSALEQLRGEEFTWDEDINFIQNTFRDPDFLALCDVNDRVATSQGFEQPVASVEEVMKEVFDELRMETDEERDLHGLLSRPHMQKLLSVHDIVRSRSYEAPVPQFDPTWHPQTNYDRHIGKRKGKGPEYRTVGLHKSADEPLGITLKLVSNHLIIARILFGGIIHRQGLLKVGDRIVEVNNESVDAMSPADFQAMMQNSSGSIVIKVEPHFQENAGATEVYMKAHFDYNPKQDRLIPSQDAGLPFKKGDILTVMNQEDSFWWQAVRYGEHELAKLIPSQMLEERRKAYQTHDGNSFVSCLGKRKQKKKIIYSSHHSGEFEAYDIVLYEPVVLKENFQYGTLVLIGAPNIGRRSLKTRLLSEYPSRFAEVKAHTTRQPHPDEDPNSFYFVREDDMRAEIMKHKFIEFGKHQQHLYGIKSDSVLDVIQNGKMCIMDVHPQALKLLRTSQFRPLVIFVKAASPEGVRKLHTSARVDNKQGHSMLSEEDYSRCSEESNRIEDLYGHFFDAMIVNENIDTAYEELLATIRVFSTGKHWVPANWVM